ncbi:MAG: spondin domain-containing protein [Verrucomicrobiota bacterium]
MITITSMIAPSPDWFVGLRGQSLLKENDDWVDSLSFELVAYDAGTEDGESFSLSNPATVPADPISLIPASHPAFAPASGPVGDRIPIARIVIERIDP